MKDRERDISEQIALGLPAKVTQGGEAMFDQRLFNNSKGMDSGEFYLATHIQFKFLFKLSPLQ